ncbi:MAG: hypothetical protein ABEK12_00860, partial [Candidatus Nanohaloarchaea archaeon]
LPITSRNAQRQLDVEYIDLYVSETVFGSRLQIQEAPRQITLPANGSTSIPVLIRNTGTTNLTNVSVELRDIRGVRGLQASDIAGVSVHETGAVTVNLTADAQVESANATLVVSTPSGAYSFADVQIST